MRLTREESDALFRAFHDGDRAAREKLILAYQPLVARCAMAFRTAPLPIEDLFQQGNVGLLLAIDKFTLDRGTSFASLAIPEIRGSILNFLRDHGTAIKFPRDLRRRSIVAVALRHTLAASLGRWPTKDEMIAKMGVTREQYDKSLGYALASRISSIDVEVGNHWKTMGDGLEGAKSFHDMHGEEDEAFDQAESGDVFDKLVAILDPRARKAVEMRFREDQSQYAIAKQIGTSQMHVSRILRAATEKMRAYLEAQGITGVNV